MSKQKLDPEKLKAVLKNLNQCETTIVDNLFKIKGKYLSLAETEIWLGPKSEKFYESIRNYWGEFSPNFVGPYLEKDFALVNGPIIENVENDFKNLAGFINLAIAEITKTDENVSDNIEGSTSNQANNKPNTENKEESSTAPSTTSPSTTKPAESTTKPAEPTTKKEPAMAPPSSSSSVATSTGKIELKNGNVIDASNPVYVSDKKYNLTDEEIEYLAYVVYKEQGSVEGAKIEASLIANLYESYRGNSYRDEGIQGYVEGTKWFASSSKPDSVSDYEKVPNFEAYKNVVSDVLVDGNRYLTNDIDEHYTLNSINYAKNGEQTISRNENGKYDRSDFIPGETVINIGKGSNNVSYVFVGFAPNNGDPFGYIP